MPSMAAARTYGIRYTYPRFNGVSKYYQRYNSYFRIAKTISELSTYRHQHIGCVAVLNHRIISSGFNSNKSDPLQKELNVLRFEDDETFLCNHATHAEMSCLKPLIGTDVNFSRVELYVYRQTRRDEIALARPCDGCMKLIRDLGIRTIYYTGDNEFFKEDVQRSKVIKLV